MTASDRNVKKIHNNYKQIDNDNNEKQRMIMRINLFLKIIIITQQNNYDKNNKNHNNKDPKKRATILLTKTITKIITFQ